jgi:branched-chain amino acid transport system substrate-binding protein
MGSRKAACLIATLAMVAAVVAGCSSSGGSESAGSSSSSGGAGGSSADSSAPGVTNDSIKIGLVTDETGGLGSTFSDVPKGVQAVFDQVNAAGGVGGRKLQLIVADTASSPTQGDVAVQSLLNQGVFEIISSSGVAPIGVYQTLQQQGVPVVGACHDGQEWSNPKNSNMFAWQGCNAKQPSSTTYGQILKKAGATKLAVLYLGSIASSTALAPTLEASAKAAGIPTVYKSGSVTPSQTDFTTEALAIKASHADAVMAALSVTADLGLSSALRAIGYKPKIQLFNQVGYGPSTIATPQSSAAADGDYFYTNWIPVDAPQPAARQWVQELKKWGNVTGVPSFGFADGWVDAKLAVAGLQPDRRDAPAQRLRRGRDPRVEDRLPHPVGPGHQHAGSGQLHLRGAVAERTVPCRERRQVHLRHDHSRR